MRTTTEAAGQRRAGAVVDVAEAPRWPEGEPLSVARCRECFDAPTPFTIGVEDELMLVDPTSLELVPANDDVVALFPGSDLYRREVRAAQIEIVTPTTATAAEACAILADARRTLIERLDGSLRLLAAGTHPTSNENAWGEISDADRYRLLADEYEWATRRTLMSGLHIHVAVGGAERTLAVYNALRSYLPPIAALAANSPFFEGRDTGAASIRSKLQEAFPRAGIPPAFASWDEYADLLAWGRAGGLFPDSTHLWWDLRLHPAFGTVEVRVADAQTRVEDAAAIAAVVHALVVWLARRFDAGEPLRVDDHFRLHENAWRASRHGVSGWLVDCRTAERVETRTLLARLLSDLEPIAAELDASEHLAAARVLLAGNGADRQRYVAERDGLPGLTRWLVDETEAVALGD